MTAPDLHAEYVAALLIIVGAMGALVMALWPEPPLA